MFGHDDLGFWQGIVETLSGRGQFRLILQPVIAIALGIKFGITDAKAGSDPFVFRLATSKDRAKLAKLAFKSIVMPFTLAIVMDGVLQFLALGYVRPMAAVLVGLALVFVPFSIARSLTNRIYRRTHHQAHAGS